MFSQANPSAPWTTVAVKPAVVHSAPTSKPVIPGLPSAGSIVQAVVRPSPSTAPSSTSKPSAVPAPIRPTPVSTPSASSIVSKPSVIRSINVNGTSSASSAQVYDAENPPPPSAEFVAWIRQALKGLQVPSKLQLFSHSRFYRDTD